MRMNRKVVLGCVMALASAWASAASHDYQIVVSGEDGKVKLEKVKLYDKDGYLYTTPEGNDYTMGSLVDLQNKVGRFKKDFLEDLSEGPGSGMSGGTLNTGYGNGTKWNAYGKGVIPFVYASDITATEKAKFQQAIDYFAANSGVRFIPRNGHANYVEVTAAAIPGGWGPYAGWSYLGMYGGKQTLHFNRQSSQNGWNLWIMKHEILHLLGYYHEHERTDRDAYTNSYGGTLICTSTYSGIQRFTAYDIGSIMHYSSWACSSQYGKDNEIWGLLTEQNTEILSPPGLSAGDLTKLQADYGLIPQVTAVNLTSGLEQCQSSGTVSWPANPEADYYEVFLNDTAGGNVSKGTTTGLSKSVSNPDDGSGDPQEYYYWVKSWTNTGLWSNSVGSQPVLCGCEAGKDC